MAMKALLLVCTSFQSHILFMSALWVNRANASMFIYLGGGRETGGSTGGEISQGGGDRDRVFNMRSLGGGVAVQLSSPTASGLRSTTPVMTSATSARPTSTTGWFSSSLFFCLYSFF